MKIRVLWKVYKWNSDLRLPHGTLVWTYLCWSALVSWYLLLCEPHQRRIGHTGLSHEDLSNDACYPHPEGVCAHVLSVILQYYTSTYLRRNKQTIWSTVNREYFVVKIFWTAWLVRKLNAQKYIRNINDNAVQGRLSENYSTWKIITWNIILDTKYSQITVYSFQLLQE